MIVADTDVLIDLLGRGAAQRVALEIEAGALATTAITRFELLSGAKGRRQLRAVEDLLAALPTLSLDADTADEAARLRRGLEAERRGIATADSLIAGIVLRHQAILLTRNRRHLERVPGLVLAQLDLDNAAD